MHCCAGPRMHHIFFQVYLFYLLHECSQGCLKYKIMAYKPIVIIQKGFFENICKEAEDIEFNSTSLVT